jgi:hypothetical protein
LNWARAIRPFLWRHDNRLKLKLWRGSRRWPQSLIGQGCLGAEAPKQCPQEQTAWNHAFNFPKKRRTCLSSLKVSFEKSCETWEKTGRQPNRQTSFATPSWFSPFEWTFADPMMRDLDTRNTEKRRTEIVEEHIGSQQNLIAPRRLAEAFPFPAPKKSNYCRNMPIGGIKETNLPSLLAIRMIWIIPTDSDLQTRQFNVAGAANQADEAVRRRTKLEPDVFSSTRDS